MDAIKLLTEQHRRLEAALKQALQAREPAARSSALARAGDDLTKHLTSEEEIFYPAVKARSTEDILRESLEEHLSLKRLLADLLTLDAAAETWEPKLKVLDEQTVHHHKEEEERLFPAVRKNMGSSGAGRPRPATARAAAGTAARWRSARNCPRSNVRSDAFEVAAGGFSVSTAGRRPTQRCPPQR